MNTAMFDLGKHYTEIGKYVDLIDKYPAAVPAEAIPADAMMAMITRRSNAKWNRWLHEVIRVGDRDYVCIGILPVKAGQREREAAILIAPTPEDYARPPRSSGERVEMIGVLEQEAAGAYLDTSEGRYDLHPAADCKLDGAAIEPLVGKRVRVEVAVAMVTASTDRPTTRKLAIRDIVAA